MRWTGRYRRLGALVLVLVAGVIAWLLVTRIGPARPPEVAQVQTTLVQRGDSLEVVTEWRLPRRALDEIDGVRVEVAPEQGAPMVTVHPSRRTSDTVHVPAPAAGKTAAGYSCVAIESDGEFSEGRCTPWQFVRPEALAREPSVDTPGAEAGTAPEVVQIVVRPSGLQVDPDVGGRCARWQRRHPDRSPWIEVNERAVAACTGPNGKPTVAQFCAFALTADGRKLQTTSSAGNPYCTRLYQEWLGEVAT